MVRTASGRSVGWDAGNLRLPGQARRTETFVPTGFVEPGLGDWPRTVNRFLRFWCF